MSDENKVRKSHQSAALLPDTEYVPEKVHRSKPVKDIYTAEAIEKINLEYQKHVQKRQKMGKGKSGMKLSFAKKRGISVARLNKILDLHQKDK